MSKTTDLEKTASHLKRETQRQNRLELNLNFTREQLRKADMRRKIQLGGLVVKAELADETTALLLGLLLDAKEKLDSNDGKQYRDTWTERGITEFETIDSEMSASGEKGHA